VRTGVPLGAVAGGVMPARSAGRDDEIPLPMVVKAWADRPVDNVVAHPRLMRELFDEALTVITGRKTPAEAWHQLLGTDARVAIKFNISGAYTLQTTPAVARLLVGSLTDAGWSPEKIVLIEASSHLVDELHTRPVPRGWSSTVSDFGSGSDQLAAVLDEVDALVNVPFLKTHNIAGMTGCLKNLSHGLVRHPARYHADGCLPYITDIVALPAIRDKLKLNVMNAIRAVYDGGPDASAGAIFNARALLVSTDPVATDYVGVEMLDQERASKKLLPVGGKERLMPLWRAAGARGLGVASRDRIRRRQVKI